MADRDPRRAPRMLAGVVQQVEDHLPQTVLVSQDEHNWRRIDGDAMISAMSQHADRFDGQIGRAHV